MKRLAKLHAFAWDTPEHAAREWLNRVSPENTANVAAIITMTAPSFFERFQQHLAPEHQTLVERVIPHITDIVAAYDGPRTLAHGDYRLDNMLFPEGSDDADDRRLADRRLGSAGRRRRAVPRRQSHDRGKAQALG